MPLITYSRNSDGNYGPTTSNHYYTSKYDHRKNAKPKKDRSGRIAKTKWKINEGQEFSVFKNASEEYTIWFSKSNDCLFSIIDDSATILGQGGERIAKFPNVSSASEPWHGYPVNTEEKQNRPSSSELDLLIEKKKISLSTRLRIERGLL